MLPKKLFDIYEFLADYLLPDPEGRNETDPEQWI